MTDNQGQVANKTGNALENIVVATLQNKGFEVERYSVYQKNPSNYGEELLLKNVPFQTLYGHRGTTEFLLLSKKHNLNIRIECKWQQVNGSVDEKFPYVYLNCLEAMPEKDIIILADGNGAKPGAVQWLREAVDNNLYTTPATADKRIKVMNMVEFLTWANKL